MDSFDTFIDSIKSGARDLAKETLTEFQKQAGDDANAFLKNSRSDLQRWSNLLSNKDISKEDFNDLVNAKKALAEMSALRESGITLIKIDNFRKGIIKLVVDTAFDTFL